MARLNNFLPRFASNGVLIAKRDMPSEAFYYQQGRVECCDLIVWQSKTAGNIGIVVAAHLFWKGSGAAQEYIFILLNTRLAYLVTEKV